MGNPKVTVTLGASNLGIVAADESGTMALIAAIPAANTSGFNTAVLIKSKTQAAAELTDLQNADALAAIQDAFFDETGEGSPLYCIFVGNDSKLADLADKTNLYFDKLQALAIKKIRAVGVIRFAPSDESAIIADGFDEDVHNAVPNAQALADQWIAQNKLIDVLIQGKGFTNVTDAKDYNAQAFPQVHIVIGSEDANEAFSVLRALGRKAAFAVHRNIGRVLSGSLGIATSGVVVKLGDTLVTDMGSIDEDTLHDKRYIFYVVNEADPGYIFNDDLSLVVSTSDYGTWANNAVIGEAMRIAYATYYKSLKDDVQVDDNGRLDKAVEKNLEQDIEDAINKQIGTSISNVSALVNPDTTQYAALYSNANINDPNLNLLQSGGKVYIFLTIRPKGYLKDINVLLGFGLS